ncbi:MAG: carboxypeptidase regulatory-like domain-containing protein, partial [Balneolaceae bacterium]|nr:carboxypeptidase regulatory-like domain-containing protein [Balneolaceae bacterium]
MNNFLQNKTTLTYHFRVLAVIVLALLATPQYVMSHNQVNDGYDLNDLDGNGQTIAYNTAEAGFATMSPMYAGGDGSDASPYEIANWYHLHNVRYNASSHFVLINDLDENSDFYDDYGGPSANGGKGFDAIGKLIGTSRDGDPFVGTFDGNGHTIYDLYIRDEMEFFDVEGGIALFSTVFEGGVIKNLNVLNATVRDNDNSSQPLAILVARLKGGTVTNVNVSGEVRTRAYGGGLVGQVDGGTISYSHADIDIGTWSVTTANNIIGGLVGLATNDDAGSIIRSSVTGSVSGGTAVGGIIGQNGNIGINQSFANVTVSGIRTTGGIAGILSNPHAMNVYVEGEVNAEESCGYIFGRATFNNTRLTSSYAAVEGNCGGLFGEDGGITVTDVYWATDLASEGDATSSTATGLTASEMQGASPLRTMDDLNYNDPWQLSDGYPRLQFEGLSVPGLIAINEIDIPAEARAGDIISVDVIAENVGSDSYTGDIVLNVTNGSEIFTTSEEISLSAGSQETITIEWESDRSLEGGDYTISVNSGHDDRSFEIEIEGNISVGGLVRDAHSMSPPDNTISGAEVTLYNPDGSEFDTNVTNSAGEFEFEYVPNSGEDFTIVVSLSGYHEESVIVNINIAEEDDLFDAGEIELRGNAEVKLSVMDAVSGNPVENAHIILTFPNDEEIEYTNATDAAGELEIGNIPGTGVEYDIKAISAGYKSDMKTAEVGDEEIITLNFTLEADLTAELNNSIPLDQNEIIIITFSDDIIEVAFGALQLQDSDDTDINFTSAEIVNGNELHISHEGLESFTDYRLTIPEHTVENSGGAANGEMSFNFKTRIPEASKVILLTPADEAKDVVLTPELSWNPTDEADTYELQLSEHADFSNPVIDEEELTETS